MQHKQQVRELEEQIFDLQDDVDVLWEMHSSLVTVTKDMVPQSSLVQAQEETERLRSQMSAEGGAQTALQEQLDQANVSCDAVLRVLLGRE